MAHGRKKQNRAKTLFEYPSIQKITNSLVMSNKIALFAFFLEKIFAKASDLTLHYLLLKLIITPMKTKHLILLVATLLLAGCRQSNPLKKTYPEYQLKSISGKTLNITSIKNRLEIPFQTQPILFIFIQPSCNSCFKGIEHIKHLYTQYQNQISMIPILIKDENNPNLYLEEAKIINKNYDLDFDFYFSSGKENFLQNFERQTDTNFIALYDSKLRLFQEYEGLVAEEMIEFDIQRVLKQMEKANATKP